MINMLIEMRIAAKAQATWTIQFCRIQHERYIMTGLAALTKTL